MKGARGSIWKVIPQIARFFPSARFISVSEGIARNNFEAMRREFSDYGLRLTIRAMVSRAGNVRVVNGRPLRKKHFNHPVSCSKVKPETLMPVVVPDGSVYACCNDYGLELPVGNLVTSTWESLDFSQVRAHQDDPTSNVPCFRGCHIAEPQSAVLCQKSGASSLWEASAVRDEDNKAG